MEGATMSLAPNYGVSIDFVEDGMQKLYAAIRAVMPDCPLLNFKRHELLQAERWMLEPLLGRDDCPAELMILLSGSQDDNVRASVAKHPAISSETYRALASDEIQKVRLAIAQNASVPVDWALFALGSCQSSKIKDVLDRRLDEVLAAATAGEVDLDMPVYGKHSLKETLQLDKRQTITDLIVAAHLEGKTQRLMTVGDEPSDVVHSAPSSLGSERRL